MLYYLISSFLPLCRRGGELLLLGGKSNQKRLRASEATIPAFVFYGAELPPVLGWFIILQCAARKFYFFVSRAQVFLSANRVRQHAANNSNILLVF